MKANLNAIALEGEEIAIERLTEERAYDLARRITRTPGYSVLEVRRAWSALWAWHVEVHEHRTGERLLLLNEDQFDARLRAGEDITVAPASVPFH